MKTKRLSASTRIILRRARNRKASVNSSRKRKLSISVPVIDPHEADIIWKKKQKSKPKKLFRQIGNRIYKML